MAHGFLFVGMRTFIAGALTDGGFIPAPTPGAVGMAGIDGILGRAPAILGNFGPMFTPLPLAMATPSS
jgi:hypothetical protein